MDDHAFFDIETRLIEWYSEVKQKRQSIILQIFEKFLIKIQISFYKE